MRKYSESSVALSRGWRFLAWSTLTLALVFWPASAVQTCNQLRQLVEENNFTVTRGLRDYARMMSGSLGKNRLNDPSWFLHDLGKLEASDQWFDMGAGEAFAGEEYLSLFRDPAKAAAKFLAVSVKVRRELPTKFGERFRLIPGTFVEQLESENLGRAKLITDVFGAFTYSAAPHEVMRKYLDLLADDGVLYVMAGTKSDIERSQVTWAGQTMTLVEWVERYVEGIEVERMVSRYTQVDRRIGAESTADVVSLRIRKKKGAPILVPELSLDPNQSAWRAAKALNIGDAWGAHLTEAIPIVDVNPIPWRHFDVTAPLPEPLRGNVAEVGEPPRSKITFPKIKEPRRERHFVTPDFQITSTVPSDRAAIARAFGDAEVRRRTGLPIAPEQVDSVITPMPLVNGEWQALNFAVLDRKTREVQGAIQLSRGMPDRMPEYAKQPGEKVAQILFAFDIGENGTKLTKMRPAIGAYAFQKLGLTRLVAKVFKEEASYRQGLIELGFTPIPGAPTFESGAARYFELRKP